MADLFTSRTTSQAIDYLLRKRYYYLFRRQFCFGCLTGFVNSELGNITTVDTGSQAGFA